VNTVTGIKVKTLIRNGSKGEPARGWSLWLNAARGNTRLRSINW